MRDKIYVIRGRQVMLDFDLAEIYGYRTSKLNEQVKNNAERFEGEDFMFQLTVEEFDDLMSENRISSWGGRRKPPKAFTEQGIYLLMTVLKGDLAVQQSRTLVRLFKNMKDYIIENQQLMITQKDYLALADKVHDRYIILDYESKYMRIYHCGASSKDAGRKVTTISEIKDQKGYAGLIKDLLAGPEMLLK